MGGVFEDAGKVARGVGNQNSQKSELKLERKTGHPYKQLICQLVARVSKRRGLRKNFPRHMFNSNLTHFKSGVNYKYSKYGCR